MVMLVILSSLYTLFFLCIIPFGFSQTEKPEHWFADINEAKEYATEKEVSILVVFAGSDWCKPCIQFKKEILSNETFNAFAKENMAILYLDFPMRKKNKLSAEQTQHNEQLAEKYNQKGAFPEIVLLNTDEKILGKFVFNNQSPESFIETYKSFIE